MKIGLVGYAVPGTKAALTALDLWDAYEFHSFLVVRHPALGFGYVEDAATDGKPVHTAACSRVVHQFLPPLDVVVSVGYPRPENLFAWAHHFGAATVLVVGRDETVRVGAWRRYTDHILTGDPRDAPALMAAVGRVRPDKKRKTD